MKLTLKYKCLKTALKRLVLIILVSFLASLPLCAQLVPGSSVSLIADQNLNTSNYSWTTDNPSIALNAIGWTCKATVEAYFGGTATITCSYNEFNIITRRYDKRYRRWSYTCVDNRVSITPSSMMLLPGKSSYIAHQLSYDTRITPKVTYSGFDANIVSVSSDGLVTGKNPGKTTVYVSTSVGSNYAPCQVTVDELPQTDVTLLSSSPSDGTSGISLFVKPITTFSSDINQGENFSSINLSGVGGKVSGVANVVGKTVVFTPDKALQPHSTYTLLFPAKSIKNRWGYSNSADFKITFTTGEKEKLTLKASPENGSFLNSGEKVSFVSSSPNASIYYTINGTKPTYSDKKYDTPILINSDMHLMAIALGDGYENSDVLDCSYYLKTMKVKKSFPLNDTLSSYLYVNPSLTFNRKVNENSNIDDVKLKKDNNFIDADVIVCDSSIYLIPAKPLEVASVYTVSVPACVVKDSRGETNDAYSWTFSTGNDVANIAIGSQDMAATIKQDGSLWSWGRDILASTYDDGSYSYKIIKSPKLFVANDVKDVSLGFMDNSLIKSDGSLWMWGRQYCGEFGDNSTTFQIQPKKVLDNVVKISSGGQTSAIIKNDGSLWMCGRNDFGQIGDSSIVCKKSPVKILDNVKCVAAGWCVTFAVKTDGSLWAWGRNDKNQLGIISLPRQTKPIKILDNVDTVCVSNGDSLDIAVIKRDHTLWAWNEVQVTPIKIDNNVVCVASGDGFLQYVKNDGTLWAIGNNIYGQLGVANTLFTKSPILVMSDVKTVKTGSLSTIVLKKDNSVWTCGRNLYGILGDSIYTPALLMTNKFVKIMDGHHYTTLTGAVSYINNLNLTLWEKGVFPIFPTPLNAEFSSISWSSDDSKIATVSDRGVISPVSEGTTNIKVVLSDHSGKFFSQICKVSIGSSTGIKTNTLSDNKVWISDSKINISGLADYDKVKVYSYSGILIYKSVVSSSVVTIPIITHGIYIVKINNRTFKILY